MYISTIRPTITQRYNTILELHSTQTEYDEQRPRRLRHQIVIKLERRHRLTLQLRALPLYNCKCAYKVTMDVSCINQATELNLTKLNHFSWALPTFGLNRFKDHFSCYAPSISRLQQQHNRLAPSERPLRLNQLATIASRYWTTAESARAKAFLCPKLWECSSRSFQVAPLRCKVRLDKYSFACHFFSDSET